MTEICNPVNHNFSIFKGESHTILLNFDGEGIEGAECVVTFRRNNNSEIIKTDVVSVIDGKCEFYISEDESANLFGEGVFYYDIWVNLADGSAKPAVQGTMTIKLLTYGGVNGMYNY